MDALQNNSHSSWHNSWQSDGINAEPGMAAANNGNPRAFFAQNRENSLGDLSGSIGELRVSEPQPFHNSLGDLRFNNSFGENQVQDNFHNSCVDFSFGEFNNNNNNNNNNGLGFASGGNGFHNSSGDLHPGTFLNSYEDPSDFHNSFGEYVRNDARARAMATPSNMMMNTSEPRAQHMYRRADSGNYSQQSAPQIFVTDYDALDLQAPSVPCSISVPSDHPRSDRRRSAIEEEQFQLEFEDEESATRRRQREAQMKHNPNGLSIVDALDTAGYSNEHLDHNPFEPVPVSDLDEMLMEKIF
jgi:hypothetical protein